MRSCGDAASLAVRHVDYKPATGSRVRAPDEPPKQRRNAWIWVSAGLGLVAVALLVWSLTLRSDLDSTQDELNGAKQEATSANQELETTQQELSSTKQDLDTTAQQLDDATQAAAQPPASEEDQSNGGRAALVAAGALVTGLARELDATREDAAATEQELADAQKEADQAEQDAAEAKQQADDATDDAAKADAQVDQANAERDAAQAKATIAAECGKAYISAFGGLFGSGNVREQLPAVRQDLESITAECKAAFAGT